MSEDYSQIVSQKLYRLNFSLPIFSHNDWFWEHVSFVYVINEHLVGEFFIKDGN